MKSLKKIFFATIFFAAVFSAAFAQDDWGDGGDWGDASSDAADSSNAASAQAGGFWDRFQISGDIDLAGRAYFDSKKAANTEVRAIPQFELEIDYEGDSTNFSATLNLSERTLLHNQIDILDEFRADVFLGNFVLSAGKMKVVWGKGDKLHVLDNFNANDYTDFLIPDYLDRRAGEYMFRVQYNAPAGFRLEGIYTPIMRSEVYAEDGRWVPAKMDQMKNAVLGVVGKMPFGQGGIATVGDLLPLLETAQNLYPNTNRLEYGQFGFYGNFSIGIVDLGVSYYNGHYKQVSADLADFVTTSAMVEAGLANQVAMPSLAYDKLQVFGLDAQMAAGPFTLRAEVGYNLTKDKDGSDLAVRNNSVCYLAGFDVGIPLHNLNLNVQAAGTFTLKKDKIKDSPLKQIDADYDPTGCYSNNKLVVQLKDTFYYEKIELLIKAIYGFEKKDLVLMPEFSWKIRDGWKAALSGMYIANFRSEKTDSEFYGWLDNSFVQLDVSYSF